jgi:hypothetical protein
MFDPIVNHLDVMAASSRTNLGHTESTLVILGRDLLQQRHDQIECPVVATRHQRRAMSSTIEAAGDAHPDVGHASGVEDRLPFLRDEIIFVRPVNYDIVFSEVRLKGGDNPISRTSMRKAEHKNLGRS